MSVEALSVADHASVGGKAAGLARLVALGLPVPAALVVSTDVHRRFADQGSLPAGDLEALADALACLGTPLAVRSSATDEDGAGRSAAGQYQSVMGVADLTSLRAAVERCYRAADGERATAYRGTASAPIALVLQREAPAGRAGVGFSIDPVSGAQDEVVLEVVYGHGEGLVSGAVQPDRYRVERTGQTVRARLTEKRTASDGRGGLVPLAPSRRLARTLRDDEARAAAQLVLAAERGFGCPVDLEFCFERTKLWALQCRPVTAHG